LGRCQAWSFIFWNAELGFCTRVLQKNPVKDCPTPEINLNLEMKTTANQGETDCQEATSPLGFSSLGSHQWLNSLVSSSRRRRHDHCPCPQRGLGGFASGIANAVRSPCASYAFVLATTSAGQEGLDFHHYCHAITHWNLPSNPVDLEQREGRIHRYKGHAIRKNLADKFSSEALQSTGADAWEEIIAAGLAGREPEQNQLVPFWLFPGNAKIERHVPRLPFSREVERLDQLRRALAIYRMVFGQSRQEDLITYLLGEVPEAEREELVRELQIDLSPSSRKPDTGGEDATNATPAPVADIKSLHV